MVDGKGWYCIDCATKLGFKFENRDVDNSWIWEIGDEEVKKESASEGLERMFWSKLNGEW
jgi:hypothetical protein